MSLLPGVNLYVDQYADFTYQFPPYLANNVPVSFAGCTATLMGRITTLDTSPFVSISTTSNTQGLIVFGPVASGPTGQVTAGSVQVNFFHVWTATLFQVLLFDLEITYSNGFVQDFASGLIIPHLGVNH